MFKIKPLLFHHIKEEKLTEHLSSLHIKLPSVYMQRGMKSFANGEGIYVRRSGYINIGM